MENTEKVFDEDGIKVYKVDLWHATYKASLGLNQSFGDTVEDAITNLKANES